jgi:tetratricopeptide (TPR) repeat protein
MLRKFFPPWFLSISLLVCLISIIYFPVLQNAYIWDDDKYLTNNPYLSDWKGLKRLWFDLTAMPQYYPMVFTSFWVEEKVFGVDPTGYHVSNVLIHCANVVFLWKILELLNIRGGWLAAIIFAVHPIQVETVAWITERKNLLSGLFFFSSLYTFFRLYSPEQAASIFEKKTDKAWYYYGFSLILFVFALWSKTVVATMPAVILVILWWKQNRVSKVSILLTAPYFFIGSGFAFLTVWLEKFNVGAIGQEWDFSLLDRFLIAGRALWFYVVKLLFPFPLIFTYPRWVIDDTNWWQYLYPLTFLGIVFLLWSLRNSVGRGLLASVLLFSGTLFPALGFLDVYPMRFSFVADHFQYLPCIGVIVPLANGLLLIGQNTRYLNRVLVVTILFFLGSLTWNQSHVYRDVTTLWKDTIKKNPESWMAHYNLGLEYAANGDTRLAISSYKSTIKYKPDHYKAHFNLGNIYKQIERPRESIEAFHKALLANPEHFKSWMNMGNVYGSLKDYAMAIQAINKAIDLRPNNPNAHFNLGIIYAENNDLDKAWEEFETVLQLDPTDQQAQKALNIIMKTRK